MRRRNKIKRNEPGYLQNYEGTYRVKAEIDTSTNDYPRDYSGSIDPDFDDYYIVCKNGIQIKYGSDDIMSCFIPTIKRGIRILKKIYSDQIEPYGDQSLEIVVNALISKQILLDIEVLDFEVYFTFKEKRLEYIAEVVKASSYGAKIKALSVDNLSKDAYIIPENDLSQYKKIIGASTKNTVEKMQIIRKINKDFEAVLEAQCGSSYKVEWKNRRIDFKSYTHSKGLWDKYIEFIKENVEGKEL